MLIKLSSSDFNRFRIQSITQTKTETDGCIHTRRYGIAVMCFTEVNLEKRGKNDRFVENYHKKVGYLSTSPLIFVRWFFCMSWYSHSHRSYFPCRNLKTPPLKYRFFKTNSNEFVNFRRSFFSFFIILNIKFYWFRRIFSETKQTTSIFNCFQSFLLENIFKKLLDNFIHSWIEQILFSNKTKNPNLDVSEIRII